jgi:hypothetical protein
MITNKINSLLTSILKGREYWFKVNNGSELIPIKFWVNSSELKYVPHGGYLIVFDITIDRTELDKEYAWISDVVLTQVFTYNSQIYLKDVYKYCWWFINQRTCCLEIEVRTIKFIRYVGR